MPRAQQHSIRYTCRFCAEALVGCRSAACMQQQAPRFSFTCGWIESGVCAQLDDTSQWQQLAAALVQEQESKIDQRMIVSTHVIIMSHFLSAGLLALSPDPMCAPA